MSPPRLIFLPFDSSEGGPNAAGSGLPMVLCEWLAARGVDADAALADPLTPRQDILDDLAEAGGFQAYTGRYHPRDLLPITIQELDLDSGDVTREHDFQQSKARSLADAIAAWLGPEAPAYPADVDDHALPATPAEILLEARSMAVIATLENEPSTISMPFFAALREALDALKPRLGERFPALSLRRLAIRLAPTMTAKRSPAFPAATDDTDAGLEALLGRFTEAALPAGGQLLIDALQEGADNGHDPEAFDACLAKVAIELGDLDAADAAIKRLEGPHLAYARRLRGEAAFVAEDFDAAVEHLRAALQAARPGDRFPPLHLSTQFKQARDRGLPWSAEVAERLAAALFFSDRLQEARDAAQDGLAQAHRKSFPPDVRYRLKKWLAHISREQAITLLESDKDAGRKALDEHLQELEELWILEAREDEAIAAIDAARVLGDTELLARWQERLEEL